LLNPWKERKEGKVERSIEHYPVSPVCRPNWSFPLLHLTHFFVFTSLLPVSALSPIALCSIPVGGKLVMMRKWDAGKAIDTIQKEKVL
jgi:hypothetical protein